MKGDLISRSEALYMLGEEPVVLDGSEYAIGALEQWRYDFAVINGLPSRPERKKGRWGKTVASPALIVCNRCGRTVLKNGSVHWNFCPNCGAEMEVSK